MKQAAEARAPAVRGRLAPGQAKPPAVTFSCFWIFQLDASWKALDSARRVHAISRGREVFVAAQRNSLRLRAAYSLAGFRADADFMVWWLTQDSDALQEAALALRRSPLGDHLRYREVYLGMAAGSPYTEDHLAAFVKDEAPRQYISVYPFTKTPDWYLLPFEKRRELMVEHGEVGRPFDVGTNTVQTFGLGDAEFIVALESNTLAELVRCVEALRKVEVRRYTRLDVPVYLGRRRAIEEILGAL